MHDYRTYDDMTMHDFKDIGYWKALAEHNGAAWNACLGRLRIAEDELAGLRKLCADLQARVEAMYGEGDEGGPIPEDTQYREMPDVHPDR